MQPLGAAVIGCGVIGPAHAASFLNTPGVQLRCVCDVQIERARRLAGEMNTQAVADYREVLMDPAVQLVSITTPHPVHPEIFAQALAAGKAVICEKPLASSWTDIDQMVALAKAAPQVSSGIFQHRYSPIVLTLKKYIEQGDLGIITHGSVWFRCFRGPQYYQTDAWRGKADLEGGGVFINQAIHFIDLLTFFIGAPLNVSGHVEHRWVPDVEVEDAGTAKVTYAGGVTAELDIANLPDAKWEAKITVHGDKGSFTIGAHHRPVQVTGFRASMDEALQQAIHAEEALPILPGKPEYGPWHLLQIKDFVEAHRNGKSPMVTIADAAHTNRIVLGVYASSQHQGQTVDLSKPYRQPYRFIPMPALMSDAPVK